MSMNEFSKAITTFLTFSVAIWIAGLTYGIKKKIGLILISAGLCIIILAIVVFIGKVFVGDYNPSFSWGDTGAILAGVFSSSIWKRGISDGQWLRKKWSEVNDL